MFRYLSDKTSKFAGTSTAFLLALSLIVIWAVTGPFFHFSDLWQLLANTFTTLVTFLMVFLIQGAQNRNDKALHIKLDAIILAMDKVSNDVVSLEKESDDKIEKVTKEIHTTHE